MGRLLAIGALGIAVASCMPGPSGRAGFADGPGPVPRILPLADEMTETWR